MPLTSGMSGAVLYQSKHKSHNESSIKGPHDEAEHEIGHQDRLSLSSWYMIHCPSDKLSLRTLRLVGYSI